MQGHYYSMEQYSGGGTQSFSLYDPGELGGDGNYFQLTFDRPLTTYGTTANFVLTSWEGFIGGPARFVASGAAISEPPPGCPSVQPGCANADIFPGATPDCVVDLSDLGQVLANYAPGVGGKTRAQGDVFPLGGGDGIVDLSDLGQMLSDFGTDCR